MTRLSLIVSGCLFLAGSAGAQVGSRGNLDAVFANYGRDRLCLGDGTGGFACSDVSADGNYTNGVNLGYVDGDDNLDVVFANFYQRPNRVCFGDGAGGFACSDVGTNQGFGSYDVALGFVDGDENLDAVFAKPAKCGVLPEAEEPFDQAPAPEIQFPQGDSICLGDGVGGFACSTSFLLYFSSHGVALGFVDGDDKLDAVFANWNENDCLGRNYVCLGDGAGGFASCGIVSYDESNTADVALGFVDGDDNLDAVFANGNNFSPNQVCLGNGMGGFACSDVSTDTDYTSGVALGFVDEDRNLDAVFANASGRNRLCLGDGAGGFTCKDVSNDENDTAGVALGYVDGDRTLDAVFANASGRNRLCLGDGAGGFTCKDLSTDENYTTGVALGEVNSPSIFADGFELGGTLAWSATVP